MRRNLLSLSLDAFAAALKKGSPRFVSLRWRLRAVPNWDLFNPFRVYQDFRPFGSAQGRLWAIIGRPSGAETRRAAGNL